MARPSLANFRSVPALLAFGLTAVLGLTLDLWSKQVAMAHLAPYEPMYTQDAATGRHRINVPDDKAPVSVLVVPGWLHFQGMLNEGAVFGIGQGQRWAFVVISIAALAFVLYLFASSSNHYFYQFILGLILGGILGNMYDRVTFGFVRDFLYIFPGKRWPNTAHEVFPWIFNVADSLLCVGVALIFLYILKGSPATRDAREEPAAKAAEPA
ncbi:MAG TPA: signal peptidase II [Humisphaera sp.]